MKRAAALFALLVFFAATLTGRLVAQVPPPASGTLSGAGQCVQILSINQYVTASIVATNYSTFGRSVLVSINTGSGWTSTGHTLPNLTTVNLPNQYLTGVRACVNDYTVGSIDIAITLTGGATPTPAPTASPVPVWAYSPIPLPVVCGTAVPYCAPTPIPFPSAFFVTAAFPTPIPFPSPFNVYCNALDYPCGQPTPVPTPAGGVYPISGSITASVGTPTVVPSCPAASYPCGLPTPASSVTVNTTASPAATFSPFPGGAVVLTGPSTAPAASAGTYAACVNSAGQLCAHDSTPVQPSPLYTMPVTTAAPVTQVSASIAPFDAPAATASPNGAPTPLKLLPVSQCAPTATVMTCQTVTAGVASVHDATPVQPSPLYTMPVTTAAPITSLSVSTLPTPSSNPEPTASAGAASSTQGVETNANMTCVKPAGAVPVVTAGNRIRCQADVSGNVMVNIAAQALSPIVTAPVATAPAVQSSATALPAATSIPVIGQMYTMTGGVWAPVKGGGTNSGATGAGQSVDTVPCNPIGTLCVGPTAAPIDATSNTTTVMPEQSFNMLYNGSTWDRYQGCNTWASGQTTSATTTELVAASASNTVYVCAFAFSFASGTAVSAKLIYGTKTTTACDTGAATMVPVTLLPATGSFSQFSTTALFNNLVANEVCLVSGGSSTPTINWSLWYSKHPNP